MKKMTITGNIILDTDSVLVSGSATLKTGSHIGYCEFKVTSSNEAIFAIDVDEHLVKANGNYSLSIHCYDNENNTYALVNEDVNFVNVDLINTMHQQYLLTRDCILSKDLIKLLYNQH